MTQYAKRTAKLQHYLNYLGDLNPQFLREIKGKLKPKNIIITVVTAVFVQLAIAIAFLSRLPDVNYSAARSSSRIGFPAIDQASRYCIASITDKDYYSYNSALCYKDLQNHWVINWQLFWFDIFTTLSIIGITLLLLLGIYFLINNAKTEHKQGAINFIRLSPQSASSILIGKVLGVPILLYLFIALGLPLHTVAAIQSGISGSLLIAFDLAVIASCGLFYSLGLLISFILPKSANSLITAMVVGVFFLCTTILNTYKYDFHTSTVLDWLLIFNPYNLILYLGKNTGIAYHYFNYADLLPDSMRQAQNIEPILYSNLLFYGQALWQKIGVGIGLVIANYCLWTYWIWQSLTRRFSSLENTVINKKQSYWITGYFVAIALGFSLQTKKFYIAENIALLQFLLTLFIVGLTFALTPQRQTLENWARYRHQFKNKSTILWHELVFGEKSPSTVALAINVLIVTLYVVPSFFFFLNLEKSRFVLWSVIVSISVALLYSVIAQLILITKGKNRVAIAFGTTVLLTFAMPILMLTAEILPHSYSLVWLFTPFSFPILEYTAFSTIATAILGQWLAIILVSLQITRKLRQAGRSQTYKMFNGK